MILNCAVQNYVIAQEYTIVCCTMAERDQERNELELLDVSVLQKE